ncbi:response regulator transcription factor [uncultured Lacinutrix sp.]|uniref:response regulator n=1 Tax=uncultured Lacinutrix sp. TaxID=574032 RepID=UPI002627E6E6|nr:response regulator transcription factor [uncultured Lacinutrix sp.]
MSDKLSSIQIVLVDDHNLFRKGLEKLINMKNHDNKYSILFEADNGIDLQSKIKSIGIPNVIFMDIDMPYMDGFETVKWVKQNFSEVKIIVVSMFESEEAVIRMIRQGVDGYLSKDLEVEDLHQALEAILVEKKYYPHFASKIMAENIEKISSSGIIRVGPLAGISEREREFLEYVPTDLTYQQIADKMYLSEKTIDGYRKNMFKKFNVKSRQGLTAYLLRNKIIK